MADLNNPQHVSFMIKYCDTVPCDPRFALPHRYVDRLSPGIVTILRSGLAAKYARVSIDWETPKILFEVMKGRELATTQEQVQQLIQRGFFQPNDIEVVLFDPLR